LLIFGGGGHHEHKSAPGAHIKITATTESPYAAVTDVRGC